MQRPDAGYEPIADYGLIGDMRRAALISKGGSIDWLCWPSFDSDPVFSRLLDHADGGVCQVLGNWRFVSRCYRPGTAILETVLEDGDARLRITDFMAISVLEELPKTGADGVAQDALVRIFTCEAGDADLSLMVKPVFAWGDGDAVFRQSAGEVWTSGAISIASSHRARHIDGSILVDARLCVGETLVLVLGEGASSAFSQWKTPSGGHRLLQETETYWSRWINRFSYRGAHEALVKRSAITLKLLTHGPTGAIIAAPTTSLPEAVGFDRNWDYRFVWTRDAAFCVAAFLAVGFQREAAEFLRFLHEKDGKPGGPPLEVVYAIDGEIPGVELRSSHQGWMGSGPVRTGNDAVSQRQNEIFGEYHGALHSYLEMYGVDGLCDALVHDLKSFVAACAEAAIACWRKPDQGIWELRGSPRHLLHSKAMCWVAVDRAAKIYDRCGHVALPEWQAAREAIRRDYLLQGWDEASQAYVMEFGGSDLDISTLRLGLVGAIEPTSSRFRETIDATQTALGDGPFHYRYRLDDGLKGEEGAFMVASFWLCGALFEAGRTKAAKDVLEGVLAAANDLGLFSEQVDPATGQFLGNFPQSLSHMAVIHEVCRVYRER